MGGRAAVHGDLDGGDLEVVQPVDLSLVEQVAVGDESGIGVIWEECDELPGKGLDNVEGQGWLAAVPNDNEAPGFLVFADEGEQRLDGSVVHHGLVVLVALKAVGAGEVAGESRADDQAHVTRTEAGDVALVAQRHELELLLGRIGQEAVLLEDRSELTVGGGARASLAERFGDLAVRLVELEDDSAKSVVQMPAVSPGTKQGVVARPGFLWGAQIVHTSCISHSMPSFPESPPDGGPCEFYVPEGLSWDEGLVDHRIRSASAGHPQAGPNLE